MNKHYSLAKVMAVALSIALGGGLAHYYFKSARAPREIITTQGVISAYDAARDKDDVMKLFKDDWYWLSVNEYVPEEVAYMLDTHSPNHWEPQYTGKMNIAVLREQGKFVGFITYYMFENAGPFPVGKILFLAVSPDFRGKHYGEILLNNAMQQLFAQGAHVARLVTRIKNDKARRLYSRAGMAEMGEDNGFVHFVMVKK
jgi:ribosomal protein S18 acetylase RimI-like enzyme